MEYEKENEEFNNGIKNTFFSSNSKEAFFHLAELQRDISETIRKIRKLSDIQKNTKKVTESMQADLANLTNEYISLVKLESALISHCQDLLDHEKEEFEQQKERMISLNSKKFSKLSIEYFSSQVILEDEPYSEDCGNIKRPNHDLVIGSFACLRKKKDDFILVMIAYPTDDNRWVVYDAAPTDGTIITYTAKPHMIFPMTTSLPSKLGTELELGVGDRVLSLWREDETSIWTTQFYYGTIIENPQQRGQGYKIRFDEDQSEELVPEHFVISLSSF